MEEKFRKEILTKLSINFEVKELKQIDTVLTAILAKYEVKEKCTEVTVYQDGLPNEIKTFLVCKSIKGLTKSTLQHYRRALTHFAYNINKDIKLLNTNDIRYYLLLYEQTHNAGKSTLDDKRRVLNSFYSWMLTEELIDKNPMLRIDAIKCDKKVREPLVDIELEQMRNACNTPRERSTLELLYSTGMRVSELTALNRTDIDFTNGTVKVFGKGKKERQCFLNAKAQLYIKKYMFSRTDNNEALFVAIKKPNNRLGKGTIEKEIKELGIRANINKPVFPHRIRHTTASHMLNRGASLEEVRILLGHEKASTTQLYVKCDLDSLQQVHKRCII